MTSEETAKRIAQDMLNIAKLVLSHQKYLQPYAFMVKDNVVTDLIQLHWGDAAAKYVAMEEVSRFAKKQQADAMFVIADGWVVVKSHTGTYHQGDAERDPKRREEIAAIGFGPSIAPFTLRAPYVRNHGSIEFEENTEPQVFVGSDMLIPWWTPQA